MEARKTATGIRLSPVERQALSNLAVLEQRCASELLREMIRREARSRGVWPVQEQRPQAAAQ